MPVTFDRVRVDIGVDRRGGSALDSKTWEQVNRFSTQAAARHAQRAAKRVAPVRSSGPNNTATPHGALKNSIGRRTFRTPEGGRAELLLRVGPDPIRGLSTAGRGPYWVWVAFGTRERFTDAGRPTGRIPRNRFPLLKVLEQSRGIFGSQWDAQIRNIDNGGRPRRDLPTGGRRRF